MKNLKISSTIGIACLAVTFVHCTEPDQSTQENNNSTSTYSSGEHASGEDQMSVDTIYNDSNGNNGSASNNLDHANAGATRSDTVYHNQSTNLNRK